MKKKPAFKYLLIDVDGVMTDGKIYYNTDGKIMKVFGPADHDALNMLKDKIKIHFLSADERGFEISKKRIVEDMKFPLDLVSAKERLEWIEKNCILDESIYIGDSFVDIKIAEKVGFSIAPSDSDGNLKNTVNLILENKGGHRAVAEACHYIQQNLIKSKF